jgi:hypothetical protein
MGYVDEVLADSPSIYFRFEDSISNIGSLSGTIASNAIGYVTGPRGKAGTFNGTSSYVQVTSTNAYYGTEWAVEAYFKCASTNDYNTIVRRSGSQHVLLRVRGSNIANGNKLECYVAGNTGTVTAFTSSVNVNNNQWHHAVLTQRSGTIYMYVDGVQVGSGAGVGSISNLTSPQQIGREASGSEFFNGSLDEVAIYNHALTQARVQAHYNYVDLGPAQSLDAGAAGLMTMLSTQGPTVEYTEVVVPALVLEAGPADVLTLTGFDAELSFGPPVAVGNELLSGFLGVMEFRGVPINAPTFTDVPEEPSGYVWDFEVLMERKAMNASNPSASLEVSNDRKRVRTELITLVRA